MGAVQPVLYRGMNGPYRAGGYPWFAPPSVEKIALPATARVQQLATLSAEMDAAASPSKLAIVAPDDLAFGLGRMYEIYRELHPRSTKEVKVFRTMSAALIFLGRSSLPGP